MRRLEIDSPSSVIPADAGIQATLWSFTEANPDAGMRRHDETSLRLKARNFNYPERDINVPRLVQSE